MIRVTAKSLLLLFVSVAFLSGCEDPAVNVSTLGRKLAAPVLTSSSPFDQDLETQGYVRITGTCDPRVGSIAISFDDSTWKYAPSSTTASTTTGGTGTTYTNDSDCADGKFDIYLTKSDILNTWGIDTDSDSTDVTDIFIKGEAWFGDTRTLTITDPKKNDPTVSGKATKVVLRKVFPAAFGGAGICEMFYAVAVDANGNETSPSMATTFSLSNTTGNDIPAYTSASDCSSSYNAQTSFAIPVTNSSVALYLKMPMTPLDTAIGFSITNLVSLATSATPTQVTLRDPSSSHRFITTTDLASMYKNVCYPVTFQRMDYNKTSPYTTSSVTVSLTPSDSKLQFFTASDCNTSSKTSSVTISTSMSSVVAYVKYTFSGTSSTTFAKVDIAMSASDSNYDTPSFPFKVDLSEKTAVAKMDFWGPNSLSRSYCNAYTVVTANSNWTAVPADKDYSVVFTSSATTAGLQFFSDSSCTAVISSLVISQGAISSKVYVKSSAAQNATSQITMTPSTLSAVTRDVTVSVVATNYYLDMAQSYTFTQNTCTYVMMTLYDSTGSQIPATNPINLAFSVASSGAAAGDVTLYTDSSCTTAYSENVYAPINTYNGNQYKFYMKVASTYTSSSISLLFTGSGLITFPFMNATFTVGP